MTYFEQNLPKLRKRAGYTQESLAEVLGVSRQAVGKWESGQGMPEAATLLTLAELLGCSLDQLMRQPLEEAAFETAPGDVNNDDWAVFSQHMARFSLQIALGVALILAGTALTVAATALFHSGLVAVPLLALVAVAVFLFVFAGIDHGNFEKAYPIQPSCPYPEEEADFDAKFRGGMAAAIAGIVASVALLVTAAVFFDHYWEAMTILAAAAFLALLAACVGVIVYLGIQHSKYHPEPPKSKAARDASGVIMSLAVIVFLLLGFVFRLWHPGWLVFPIAAILCGIMDRKED